MLNFNANAKINQKAFQEDFFVRMKEGKESNELEKRNSISAKRGEGFSVAFDF
jgi:hypothetical protein